jgi:thiol-disulfide isomerase/thioredoxin
MRYLILITLSLFANYSYSQKSIDLTITIDSTINKKNIEIEYFNGSVNKDIIDTFQNNSIKLNNQYYTEYFPLIINYKPKNGKSYYHTFFLNKKKSNILLRYNIGSLEITCKNALLITDTVSNPTYKGFLKCRMETAIKMTELYEKHQGDVFKVDSLRGLRDQYIKILNQESMDFFKGHSNEYFSIYYFWQQVVTTSINLFRNDSSYLRTLVIYLKNTFPKKFQESYEGQNILLALEGYIKPPNLNTLSPYFSKTDINGKKISTESLKGKYVLFDFWGSWCPPCLASIPFLKELKAKYPADSFVIIGINTNDEIQAMRKTIINKKMNWAQIFDINNDMSNKFGVLNLPTFILVDKQGKIIFRGIGAEDLDKVSLMLNDLIHSIK